MLRLKHISYHIDPLLCMCGVVGLPPSPPPPPPPPYKVRINTSVTSCSTFYSCGLEQSLYYRLTNLLRTQSDSFRTF